MRTLVVFYSLTGNTRKLAEQAAQALEADLTEVRAPRYGQGLLGLIRASLDALRGKEPEIEVQGPSPEGYEYVLVMAPVWAKQAAAPIRIWLAGQRGRLRRAGVVLTCNGSCSPHAFEQLCESARVRPDSTLLLKAKELRGRTYLPPPFASLLASIRPTGVAANWREVMPPTTRALPRSPEPLFRRSGRPSGAGQPHPPSP
jgi:hypothetical protein